jgi:hypothetical protein
MGADYAEPRFNQPGFNQPGYDRPGYHQRGFDAPDYDQLAYRQPGYDQDPRDGQGAFGRGAPAPFAPGGPAALPAMPDESKRSRKVPVLIGAGAVVVLIGVGVVAVPKVLHHGSTDAGCTTYSSSALPVYNHAITDLNAQASQATLNKDLSSAITQLTSAVSKAQSTPVKAALQGLLTDLNAVQADVQKGTVPAATVATLNSASAAADGAC